MKGIILLALSNISRKKGQTFLIGLAIVITSLLFSSAVGLLVSVNSPVEEMFKNQKGSHILFNVDHSLYDYDAIYEWWNSREEVELIQSYDVAPHSLEIWIKNRETDTNVRLFEKPITSNGIDELIFVDGEDDDYPQDGEIWLPSAITNALGLRIGEIISLPFENGKQDFIISAIVIDPQYNGQISPRRAWISPGSLPFIFAPGKIVDNFIGVHLLDPDLTTKLWREFISDFDGRFSGYSLFYKFIIKTYSVNLETMFILILFFTIISIIISSIFIGSTISGNIYATYRQIGILKSLGYSTVSIKLSFILKYLIISIFTLPVSICVSFYLVPSGLSLFTATVGTVNNSAPFKNAILLSSIGYLVFILLVTLFSTRHLNRINTINSIRFGDEVKIKKRNFTFLINKLINSSPVLIGISSLFLSDKKGRFIINTFLTAFFAIALFFSFTTTYTISQSSSDLPAWGFPDSDIELTLKGYSYSEIKEIFGSYKEIETAFPEGYASGFRILDLKTDDMPYNCKVYDGDLKITGLRNIEGRHPEGKGEISLAYNMAKMNGYGVGDSVNVYFYGQKAIFKVVGIYQIAENLGYACRISYDSVIEFDPLYSFNTFLIKLREGISKDKFIRKIEKDFGSKVNAWDFRKLMKAQEQPMIDATKMMTIALIIVFSLITFSMIFNTTIMEINERNKTIGILKVIGFTRIQVRLIFLLKTVMTSVIGVIFGVLIGRIVTPVITYYLIGKSMGLVDFPIKYNAIIPVYTMCITVSVAIVCSWISSLYAKKIDPRNLIME